MWIEVAAVAFAIVFFLVGVFRSVEFSGLGLSNPKRWVLIGLHVIGCALFSSALIAVTLDTHARHRTFAFSLFVASLVVLAPGQVTIGLRRKQATDH